MIFLFEDRPSRMNLYLKDREALEAISRSEVIRKVAFNPLEDTLENYIQSKFDKAKVVLFHGTYKFPGGGITLTNVRNAFSKTNADFISFSGGSDLGNYFYDGRRFQGVINSGLMYENLPLLINKATRGEHPDIRLLFFGKEFLKNEILFVKKLTANFLADFSANQQLTADYLQEFKDRIIDTSINDPEFKEQKENINGWLLDKIKNEPKPSAREIKDLINKTFL